MTPALSMLWSGRRAVRRREGRSTATTLLVPTMLIGGAAVAGIAAGVAALSAGGTEATPVVPNVPAAPTVTAVSPSAGPIVGGSSATITGTNLTGATVVKIGGVSTSNFTVVNATTDYCRRACPCTRRRRCRGHDSGWHRDGDGALHLYDARPDGDVSQPVQWHDAGRHQHHHYRNRFDRRDRRDIRRRPGLERYSSSMPRPSSRLRPRIRPASWMLRSPRRVAPRYRPYTYVTPPPTVTSISPANGTTLGGTTVTITGTNLTGATAVTFGGTSGGKHHGRQRHHDHRHFACAYGRRGRCRGHDAGWHWTTRSTLT